MDPVVTARVPAAVRDRGNAVLKSIGSTPSELINCAYDYVVREKRLPRATGMCETGKRVLSESQARELASFMEGVHVPVPGSWAQTPFEHLMEAAMEERYANLH